MNNLDIRALWQAAPLNEQANFLEFIIEDFIFTTCKAGDTAIDVGANYGAHTYSMLYRVGPRGRVFAFEPNPEVFARLASWRQRFPQLQPMCMALSNHAGTGNLSVPQAGSGYGSLVSRTGGSVARVFQVKVDRLDDIPEVATSLDLSLIKVDVEGEEISFLRGAIETISKARPMVLMEIAWGHCFATGGERMEDFFSMLERINYAVYNFFGERLVGRDWISWEVVLAPKEKTNEVWLTERCRDVGARFFSSFRDWTPYQKLNAPSPNGRLGRPAKGGIE